MTLHVKRKIKACIKPFTVLGLCCMTTMGISHGSTLCSNGGLTMVFENVNFDTSLYDPFTSGTLLSSALIRVGNQTGEKCEGTLFLNSISNSNPHNGTLGLQNNANTTIIPDVSAPSSMIDSISLEHGQDIAIPVFLSYNVSSISNPIENKSVAETQEFFQLGLDTNGDNAGDVFGGSNIGIDIPSQRKLSVSQTGSTYVSSNNTTALAFGNLTSGQQETFNITAQSTANYKISVSSDNGGFLCHETSCSSSDHEQISYTLDGYANISGTTAIDIINNGVATNADGKNYPMTMTIGNLDNKRAGNYSDTLTFSVSAR